MPDEPELLEVEIEKIVAGGDGLGRHEGRAVFVPLTAPGERHRVLVSERRRDFLRGRSVARLETSPSRRAAPCRYYGACGGCSLMHLEPEAQLEVKRAVLLESFARSGVEVSSEVVAVYGADETRYRNRLRFHVDARGGRVRLGFRRRGGLEVEDVEECLLGTEGSNERLRFVRSLLSRSPGLASALEAVEFLESSDGKGRAAARFVVRSREGVDAFDEEIRTRMERDGGLQGFVVETSRPRGRRLRAEGEPVVTHAVGGRVFRQSAGSFFQANRLLLDTLVSEATPREPVERIVDLYAGVGLFALALAPLAREVVAVESSSSAVRDGVRNARDSAGSEAVRFIEADAVRFAESFGFRGSDYVILDPPRGGLPKALTKRIGASPLGRLCYVSCDAPSLARDSARLAADGFEIDRLSLIDLFPNTHHFETVLHATRPSARLD